MIISMLLLKTSLFSSFFLTYTLTDTVRVEPTISTYTYTGKVVDAMTSRSVPGVKVVIFAGDLQQGPDELTKTNQSGKYSFVTTVINGWVDKPWLMICYREGYRDTIIHLDSRDCCTDKLPVIRLTPDESVKTDRTGLIYGWVYASSMISKRPAPRVEVYLGDASTHRRAITDTNGFYVIPGIVPGLHTLVFSKQGYPCIKKRLLTIKCEASLDA